MSQTAQIVIAVIVLAVVASMAAKAISAATRALSSLVGFAAIVFVACGSTDGVAPGILGVVAALAAFIPAARAVAAAPHRERSS